MSDAGTPHRRNQLRKIISNNHQSVDYESNPRPITPAASIKKLFLCGNSFLLERVSGQSNTTNSTQTGKLGIDGVIDAIVSRKLLVGLALVALFILVLVRVLTKQDKRRAYHRLMESD